LLLQEKYTNKARRVFHENNLFSNFAARREQNSKYHDSTNHTEKEDTVKTEKIISLVATFTIMLLSLFTLASAQHLMDDTVWLKMKVCVKGHSISAPAEPIEPYKTVCTIYVRFSPTVNAFEHDWQLWAYDYEASDWIEYDNGTLHIYGERDGIIMGWSPFWFINNGTSALADLNPEINGFMKLKRDGLVTKSAKFTTDGCTLHGNASGRGIYCGCKVTGSLIKPDKLPFTYP
jgi:hypothetical protein